MWCCKHHEKGTSGSRFCYDKKCICFVLFDLLLSSVFLRRQKSVFQTFRWFAQGILHRLSKIPWFARERQEWFHILFWHLFCSFCKLANGRKVSQTFRWFARSGFLWHTGWRTHRFDHLLCEVRALRASLEFWEDTRSVQSTDRQTHSQDSQF
jgi:hypothetical protein